ncbi:MAG: DUF1028 domain-containing protein [Chloroflexi bacterium]|nr:DUF1028 domain-containing protein [Chloroflexota bacterium]
MDHDYYATFSIVGRLAHTGELGVASATRRCAVGAKVPFARPDVGAVASQAQANPRLALNVLDLLSSGVSAPLALELVMQSEAQPNIRQVIVVDASGLSAGFTGSETEDAKHHVVGPNFAAAGNKLVSKEVVEEMARAFQEASGDLAERLMAALEAGDAAGGDKRGKQSAALRVVRDETVPYLDLRVDDHPEPIAELRRILGVKRRDMEMSKRGRETQQP